MQLFVDLSALNSDVGPSGAAYCLLQRAGYRPAVQYLPPGGRHEVLQQLTGHTNIPQLVTDAGEVITTLSGIVEWIDGMQRVAVPAQPAVAPATAAPTI